MPFILVAGFVAAISGTAFAAYEKGRRDQLKDDMENIERLQKSLDLLEKKLSLYEHLYEGCPGSEERPDLRVVQ